MKDLQDLYEFVVNGYQNGELEAANEMQPHLYAHQLWSLYKYISKFFTKRLLEQDLWNGWKLCNPLKVFNSEIAKYTTVHTSGVPKMMLPTARPSSPTELPDDSQHKKGNARHQNREAWRFKRSRKTSIIKTQNKSNGKTTQNLTPHWRWQNRVLSKHMIEWIRACWCMQTEQWQLKHAPIWEYPQPSVDNTYCGDHVETPLVCLHTIPSNSWQRQATQAKEMLNKGSTKLLAKSPKQEWMVVPEPTPKLSKQWQRQATVSYNTATHQEIELHAIISWEYIKQKKHMCKDIPNNSKRNKANTERDAKKLQYIVKNPRKKEKKEKTHAWTTMSKNRNNKKATKTRKTTTTGAKQKKPITK